MTEEDTKPSTLATISIVFITLSQLPALAIWATWDLQERKLIDQATVFYVIALFSPPILWLGWLIAIPTLLRSKDARQSPIMWLALAIGVSAWLKYEAVIWAPLNNMKFY